MPEEVGDVDRPVLDRVDAEATDGHDEPLEAASRRRRPTGEPPPLPAAERWRGQRWVIVAVAAVAASLVSLAYAESELVTSVDAAITEAFLTLRTDVTVELSRALSRLTADPVLSVLRWGTIAVLLGVRRLRHLFVFVGAVLLVEYFAALLNFAVTRPRPLVPILGEWEGFSHPSRQFAGLTVTLIGMVRVLVPHGRLRDRVTWGVGGLLVLVGLARILLGVDHFTDVLVGGGIGAGIAFGAFRLLAPSRIVPVVYRRGETAHVDLDESRRRGIRDAMRDQLGLVVREIELHRGEGSAGSTPLRIDVRDEHEVHPVFGKLYTQQHLRSDRNYKLVRTLLYGQLEDEAPFSTIRQLVEYEDHMQRYLRDAGIRVAEPYGIVEITPGREYLVVTEFLEGDELGEVELSDELIDDALHQVQLMWAGGIAHRDIKPSNIMVSDGGIHIVDTAFTALRPSPWRQAVDLAAMMLVLALRTDAERVYRRACEQFSEDEIAEAFAAAHGFAIPRELRSALEDDDRDLVARFRELAPDRPSIRVQRWGRRRLLVAFGVGLAAGVFGWLAWASFSTAGML